MTEVEAEQKLHSILDTLDIHRGDLVYLGVDMGGVILPAYPAELNGQAIRGREKGWCEFLLSSLITYLGPEGTILAPAFTYSCSAPGSIFIVEDTPAEVGPFTSFLSLHPLARRSSHPLFSVSGIGPLTQKILDDTGKAAFGARSVFGRLNDYDCKFLCLGTSIGTSLTYIHHLEQTYGCNGRYNKMFHTKVMRNLEEVPGPWLAYVGYHSIVHAPQCETIEKQLRQAGVLKETYFKSRPYQSVNIRDVNQVGYSMLEANQCAFRAYDTEVILDETEMKKAPLSGPMVKLNLFSSNE